MEIRNYISKWNREKGDVPNNFHWWLLPLSLGRGCCSPCSSVIPVPISRCFLWHQRWNWRSKVIVVISIMRHIMLRLKTPAYNRKGLIKGVQLCDFTSKPLDNHAGNWRTCYCSWISAWSPNSPAILWKLPSPPTRKKNPLSALTIVKGQQFLISGNSFSLSALFSLHHASLCTLQCWTGVGMAAEDTWHCVIHPEQKERTAREGQELEKSPF